MENFYAILGVEKEASQEEIKAAYKRRAQTLHPDKETGDEEKFKALNAAFSALSDPDKRKRYDEFGEAGLDDSAIRLREEAMNQILELVKMALQRPHRDPEAVDIFQEVRQILNSAIDEGNNSLKRLEAAVKKLTSISKRIKIKNGNKNIILSFVETQIATEKNKIIGVQQQIAVVRESKRIMKDYEYEFESKSADPYSIFRGGKQL